MRSSNTGHTVFDERMREGHLQSACAGLKLTLPVENSEELRQMRDAIDFLNVLWALDSELWRAALEGGVNLPVPGSMELLDASETPHIVLSFHHDKFPWQLNDARWSALVCPSTASSPDMEKAVNKLLAVEYNDLRVDNKVTVPMPIVPAIPLRLRFLVFGMATAVVHEYLSKAVDMVETVQRDLSASTPTFVLDAVSVDLSAYEMSRSIAEQLLRLHGLGVRFHQLTLRLCETGASEEVLPVVNLTRFLTTLIPPRSRSRNHAAEPVEFPVHTLVIDRADRDPFRVVCAAIATTDAVKNLQLRNVFVFDSPEDRAFKWQCLTEAVLSPLARTSVKHLAISQTNFEPEDAYAVATVLNSVGQLEEHQRHALRTLDIACEASLPATLQVVPQLLQLIGQDLRCLSVYSWMEEMNEATFRGIVDACPYLEMLDVANLNLESMTAVVDLLQAPQCSIRALALHNIEIAHSGFVTFIEDLQRLEHPAITRLKEVCFDGVGVESEFDLPSVNAVVSMLQVNRSLQYLELRMNQPLLSSMRRSFTCLDGQWLPVPLHPLALRSKLAFLSVLPRFGRAHHDRQSSSAREQMDETIAAMIFRFAATPARRKIYLDEP